MYGCAARTVGSVGRDVNVDDTGEEPHYMKERTED